MSRDVPAMLERLLPAAGRQTRPIAPGTKAGLGQPPMPAGPGKQPGLDRAPMYAIQC